MKQVFLPEASGHIDRLDTFLIETAGKAPAAQKAMLAINESIDMLLENPHMGVSMDHDPAYRQLYVPFGKRAYVLRYRIDTDKDTLVVVRVWHSLESRNYWGGKKHHRASRNLLCERITTTIITMDETGGSVSRDGTAIRSNWRASANGRDGTVRRSSWPPGVTAKGGWVHGRAQRRPAFHGAPAP